jgi:3-oxoacyl-[acyl-carrier-protein] synthase III
MSVEAIEFALPSIRQTAADIAAATGADPEFISGKVGLSERHILGPDETGVSLSVAACHALFQRFPDLAAQVGSRSPSRTCSH